MGQGWRRVSEAVRQKVGLATDKTFQATSNSRNEAMFKEATDFSVHLRVLERDLRSLQKQVECNFINLRGILVSPLPRVYEEGREGAVASEEEARMIGQNVDVDSILGAAQEMKRRQEQEVIQPLKQWMVAYRTIQDRMKKLESLRLEVDSRRRTVTTLEGKLVRLDTTAASNTKVEDEKQRTHFQREHKNEKMHRTMTQYQELEQTVFNSLFTLVKDTSVLRDYAAASVQIVQECYQGATAAFSGQGMPLEYQSTTGAFGLDHAYAEVTANPTMGDKSKVVSRSPSMMRTLPERMKPKESAYPPAPETDASDGGYEQLHNGYGGYDAAHMPANPYSAVYNQSPSGRYVTAPPTQAWQQGY